MHNHLWRDLHACLQLCWLTQQCSQLSCLAQCCRHLVHDTTGSAHTQVLQPRAQHRTTADRVGLKGGKGGKQDRQTLWHRRFAD